MALMVPSRVMPGVLWRMKSTVASTSRASADSKPEISLMVYLIFDAGQWSALFIAVAVNIIYNKHCGKYYFTSMIKEGRDNAIQRDRQ